MDVIDKEGLLASFAGVEEVLVEIIGIFLKDMDQMLGEIDKAIQEENNESLVLHAHTMKGTAMNFKASRVADVSRDLEAMAKSGVLDDPAGKFELLKEEIQKVIPILEEISKDLEG